MPAGKGGRAAKGGRGKGSSQSRKAVKTVKADDLEFLSSDEDDEPNTDESYIQSLGQPKYRLLGMNKEGKIINKTRLLGMNKKGKIINKTNYTLLKGQKLF